MDEIWRRSGRERLWALAPVNRPSPETEHSKSRTHTHYREYNKYWEETSLVGRFKIFKGEKICRKVLRRKYPLQKSTEIVFEWNLFSSA